MDISISQMGKSDIDGIFEIEKASYGEHHWSKDSFFNEVDNKISYYIVAKNSETKEVVGYLGSWFIEYITLEVRISNTPAISLYEKFGFKSVGVRKKYYQDNDEDALIMFTENIWHEKFKTVYNKLTGKI